MDGVAGSRERGRLPADVQDAQGLSLLIADATGNRLSGTQRMSAPGTDGLPGALTSDARGATVFAWLETTNLQDTGPLRAALRPPGGTFGQPETVYPAAAVPDSPNSVAAAFDPAGHATLGWWVPAGAYTPSVMAVATSG